MVNYARLPLGKWLFESAYGYHGCPGIQLILIVDRGKRNPNQQKDTVPHESDARGRITCEGHGYQKLVTLGKDLEVRTCNYVIDQTDFYPVTFRYKPRRLGKTSNATIT